MFLGDESGALHWLDRVIENREVYRLGHIRCAHYLDALRPESGFRAIVERLDDRERAGSPLREVVLAALGP